jgi:hypothetical protein
MLLAQLMPFHPAVQAQLYAATPSVHTPLFAQGIDAQSSMLVWQL